MGHFAWDIRGGDTIYVADAASGQIVGVGHATAAIGQPAYRFDANSPIAPPGGEMWRHLIDMDWDEAFAPFTYENLRAANITVLELEQDEVQSFDREAQAAEHRNRGLLTEEDVQGTLLLETGYSRYTPAALRLIHRKHVAMSNAFTRWLRNSYGVRIIQEQHQIDATFEMGGKRYLAEFKIAYQGNTKRAIREALGQILEYNHYPPRISYDHWLLILDIAPCQEDKIFLGRLRDTFRVPLTLGWEQAAAFVFDPLLSF